MSMNAIYGAACCAMYLVAQQGVAKEPAEADSEERIFIGQPDGSGMKLLTELADYRPQRSQSWSSDGRRIAFDAWRSARGEKSNDSQIIVANADGSEPKILGDGALPSFSPRGKRIVFSRFKPNPGVWVMSSEGPETELVQLDEEGWAAVWSPDGRQIAYTVPDGKPANLYVFDLVEGQRTALFEEGKCPYKTFFWYFSWSPDSRRIAFKGKRIGSDKQEIGIIDARGAKHGLITRYEAKIIWNLSWSSDRNRIFFAQPVAKLNNRNQIWWMNADTHDEPELLAGQNTERGNSAAVFSPDGKRLLMISRKPTAAANTKK
jgi:Tol biopolymer transport system component